ncbi:MAG: response regulator [Gammaproteobacteria bacterium]|nr:response regulator [Gammaproteobacteria bacterium]
MNTVPERILLVDDDVELRGMLARYLSAEGFHVSVAGDGREMRTAMAREAPSLVVLDWMLPGEDGLSLARSLHGGPAAVIMLSARGDTTDRILALEIGADDYLSKPFDPRELLARIHAVLRRHKAPAAETPRFFKFGSFNLDPAAHLLARNDKNVPLTTGEFTLLHIFVRNPGRVLSRDDLARLARNDERMPFDRSIDVRVARLRQKIEDDPENPRFIRTVWGSGYLFVPDGGDQP